MIGPAKAGRRRAFGFALFAVSIVGSAGFTACASLKSATLADAGPDETRADADVDDTGDAGAPDDASELEDAPLTDADAARSSWPFCSTNGAMCSCLSWPAEVDSSSCAATDFPSGFCCADPGWPSASNATCTCSAWTCRTMASGTCVCGALEGGTTSSCSDTFCCAHPIVGTCGCASTTNAACPSAFTDANNIPVTSCTLGAQPCPRGGTRVSTCTF